MNWKLQVYSIVGVVLLGYICNYLIDRYIEVRDENESLKQQNQHQQSITDNAYHSIRLFHDISRINSENRQRSAVDSEKTQAAIKTIVVNHDCAARTVPDGAVSRLQQHANRIRSGAADTDSGASAR
ncbi:hypothetical protein [Xenorhabdus griffiniae]|uniref:Bacteriophage protein n=1 Tax=Xenorhabdus griffiniae TaxID=351672 RepID=A0ABY9XKQ3_9GAMM|nr:hypothetical protein [Xenorhabdus griffiniae]MBD1229546.1 hypothetical protein [Xenorhabdus griffiniae]MBE8589368.1 hypothetical protein [Xenorhabdus griffiniae]WMV73521.1 hypothetical protein QL128_05730 [Xenorhabdus griffiniae]WMV74026.1 hypothetical protein QL128_08540 [Xenorhabdus griffiniae]WNH03201.1 hypothetical protein QL112_005735 [Xenorhabdus griffiniae]